VSSIQSASLRVTALVPTFRSDCGQPVGVRPVVRFHSGSQRRRRRTSPSSQAGTPVSPSRLASPRPSSGCRSLRLFGRPPRGETVGPSGQWRALRSPPPLVGSPHLRGRGSPGEWPRLPSAKGRAPVRTRSVLRRSRLTPDSRTDRIRRDLERSLSGPPCAARTSAQPPVDGVDCDQDRADRAVANSVTSHSKRFGVQIPNSIVLTHPAR
jgi:hypothetical protein